MRKPLTSEMVLNRSKVSDMSKIIKLNCWGCDLDDISILKSLPYLEVLSLSVNEVRDISILRYCTKLRELFLRQNQISDLNQVCYLRNLNDLSILSLIENPCTTSEHYRYTVIRELPNLQTLDNTPISPDERHDAVKKGLILRRPDSESNSENDEDGESDYENYNGNGNYTSSPEGHASKQESENENSESESYNRVIVQAPQRKQPSPELTPQYAKQTTHFLQQPNHDNLSRSQSRQPSLVNRNESVIRNNFGSNHNHDPENREKHNLHCCCSKLNNRFSAKCRIESRNTNVLSAVLCLISELDCSSLEVVGVEIRRRLDSLKCDGSD